MLVDEAHAFCTRVSVGRTATITTKSAIQGTRELLKRLRTPFHQSLNLHWDGKQVHNIAVIHCSVHCRLLEHTDLESEQGFFLVASDIIHNCEAPLAVTVKTTATPISRLKATALRCQRTAPVCRSGPFPSGFRCRRNGRRDHSWSHYSR